MTGRMRAVLLASIVVLSMLAGPMTGTVAAQTDVCTELDEFIWVFTIGVFNSDKCDSSTLSQEIQDMEAAEDNQTSLDIYNALTAQDANSENMKDVITSYGQDTETFGFIKGENATVTSLQAGDTRSQMNNSVTAAVGDYYTAAQEKRLIRSLESTHRAAHYAVQRAKNESIPIGNVIRLEDQDGGSFTDANGYSRGQNMFDIRDSRLVETQYTYVNGSTENITVLELEVEYETGGPVWNGMSIFGDLTFSDPGGSFSTNPNFEGLRAMPPSGSSLSEVTILNEYETEPIANDIDARTVRVIDNARQYGNAMYDRAESGSFDVGNYTSPYLMAQEWATDYNATGYWSYAVAISSAAGFETPNLNTTGRMSVEVGGNIYTGLLFSATPPTGGQWNTSETYDGAAINGSQFFITDDGKKLDLSESSFTVTEIQDKDGSVLNSTSVNKYTYQTVNSSKYEELQQQVLDLIQQIEEREPVGAGGSGSSGTGWPPFGLTNAQAAVGGAAIIGLGALSMSRGRGRSW